jgi:transposase
MKKTEKMTIINHYAAGIDVGSKTHYVAVGQNDSEVKEFGVYTEDHERMVEYLNSCKIKTIAMESTGSYWQNLFSSLQSAGFEVILVSGQQTKNVRAKTDVKDCQWIQKLHSLGLLRGCYLPSESTYKIRTLNRHRQSLIEDAAALSNKMQKALRLMNLRLDVVLSDITGKSGIAIIEAVLSGKREAKELAALTHNRVRKTKTEIAKALHGNWNEEHLFELHQCYELYKVYQTKIADCDKAIEKLLLPYSESRESYEAPKKRLKSKNHHKINLPLYSYGMFGVDLFSIDGVSVNTIMTFIAEVGVDIYKFKTAKAFTSWLRLAPNNKISGGKLISSRTPKGKNKFTLALRNAANTIDRLKEGALMNFFKRIAYKKGRASAITATARKLAIIIWNMVTKKQCYNPIENNLYLEKVKAQKIFHIKKAMKKLGIQTSELSMG